MKYLLDTDVIIDHLRGKTDLSDSLKSDNLSISIITYGELIFGSEKSEQKEKTKKLVLDFINDLSIKIITLDQKIMEEYGSTGIQEVMDKIVFEILKYNAVYPAGLKLVDSKGNVLPDCYLMPPNSTALDFAYRLHSDIGRDFVKAVHIKTRQGVGKDYVLKNGDGLEILTK